MGRIVFRIGGSGMVPWEGTDTANTLLTTRKFGEGDMSTG